jgi:hypothetical protein
MKYDDNNPQPVSRLKRFTKNLDEVKNLISKF